MKMLEKLMWHCSAKCRLDLVKADLIHQLIVSLNPQSHSFAEAVDIHINVTNIIFYSFYLTTPYGLEQLGIEDDNEQQTVCQTILQQVLVPSEKYICHLCKNHYSIVDGDQSKAFLELLARLLQISPFYQPTMHFVLHMPVVLTIPSCLTFFENEHSIWAFLFHMIDAQREWNKQSGEVQKKGKTVIRRLRMEGIEDVFEEKLQNDQHEYKGRRIVEKSIKWSNLQGMNLR
ncbi:hypothetical protein BLNAU_18549 [Blattamonas nauphoetae]|uniref:Uncharacterized protein n=1 Tax=Blattamonas nauphoetae TaxID=2049346 RepID=A0ABQ9X497_9EUKA|nr:hypothetical protein BLNAU_18549 [Blattamonas nauphoetae]